MTSLSCSCGAVMPLVPSQVPHVLVCPGCGVRFQTIDSADGTTTITVLGVDPAWEPPKFEPRLALIGDSSRRERVLQNILAMSALAGGAMPIGLGIPYQQELIDDARALVLKRRLDEIATVRPYLGPFTMPSLPGRQQRRSLVERKARRAKRKQRRNR